MILLYYFLQLHVNLELSQNNVKFKISIYSISSYFQNISIAIIFRFKDKIKSLSMGFPDSSVGKESTCNVGDLGSIPGVERSPGEGKGYPLQYSGLENSMDSPWVRKEANTTDRL